MAAAISLLSSLDIAMIPGVSERNAEADFEERPS
jgi:hypothetical protein